MPGNDFRRTRKRWSLLLAVVLSLVFFASGFPLSITAESPQEERTVMVFTVGSRSYSVNGESATMDVSPVIVEGRTFLPIKYAASPLGAGVFWNAGEEKVTVILGETRIEMWIGRSAAQLNGSSIAIEAGNPSVIPFILDGRTMLPLRFVTENLGCGLGWDPVTKEATVSKVIPSADGGDSGGSGGSINPPSGLGPWDIVGPGGVILDRLELIKSLDLTPINDSWSSSPLNQSVPVSTDENILPLVMRIGCGYDVFGEYASVNSLKEPVLNTNRLVADGRILRIRYDGSVTTSNEAASIHVETVVLMSRVDE